MAAAGGRFYLASGLWTRRGHGNGCLGRPGDRGDACAADQRPGRRRAFAGAGLERGSGRGLIEEHLRLPIWRSVSVSQNSWFVVIRSPRVGWQSGWQQSGKSDPMKKHPALKCRARTRSGCPCQKSPVAGKKTGVGFTVVGRRVPRRPKARPAADRRFLICRHQPQHMGKIDRNLPDFPPSLLARLSPRVRELTQEAAWNVQKAML